MTTLPDVSEQGWRSLCALYFAEEFVCVEDTGKMVAILPGDRAFEIRDEIDELLTRGYVREEGDTIRITEQGAYQVKRFLRRHRKEYLEAKAS